MQFAAGSLQEQMRAGFQRVYDQMVDISIDAPHSYSVLERWMLRCQQAGIINDDILKKMPSRERKRSHQGQLILVI